MIFSFTFFPSHFFLRIFVRTFFFSEKILEATASLFFFVFPQKISLGSPFYLFCTSSENKTAGVLSLLTITIVRDLTSENIYTGWYHSFRNLVCFRLKMKFIKFLFIFTSLLIRSYSCCVFHRKKIPQFNNLWNSGSCKDLKLRTTPVCVSFFLVLHLIHYYYVLFSLSCSCLWVRYELFFSR